MFSHFDLTYFLISMVVIVFAIGFHEFAHAKFADLAGDPTPRMMGRVTLNPLAHLDPIGTIMLVITSIAGIGIGWGKPVLVRPDKMRNPRWDHFLSVAAGPLSNLLQAAVYALILRLMMVANGAAAASVGAFLGHDLNNIFVIFLFTGVLINLSLFAFNLIPLGPLDGHWLVGAFLPEPARIRWYQFNRGIGGILFLILVFIPAASGFDLLGMFVGRIVLPLFRLLTGIHL